MHLYNLFIGNPSIFAMENEVHERVKRNPTDNCMCPCACTTTTTTESTTTSKILMSDVFITIFNKKSLSNNSLKV
jgi:hypothetical protein